MAIPNLVQILIFEDVVEKKSYLAKSSGSRNRNLN
jgi:hypothetical protein